MCSQQVDCFLHIFKKKFFNLIKTKEEKIFSIFIYHDIFAHITLLFCSFLDLLLSCNQFIFFQFNSTGDSNSQNLQTKGKVQAFFILD